MLTRLGAPCLAHAAPHVPRRPQRQIGLRCASLDAGDAAYASLLAGVCASSAIPLLRHSVSSTVATTYSRLASRLGGGDLQQPEQQQPEPQPQPRGGSLPWMAFTVIASLPLINWAAWPLVGLHQASFRLRDVVPRYWLYTLAYALPFLRSALLGGDAWALPSIAVGVAHVQVEYLLAAASLGGATVASTSTAASSAATAAPASPDAAELPAAGTSSAPSAAAPGQQPGAAATQAADPGSGSGSGGGASSSSSVQAWEAQQRAEWDQRFALRCMTVPQLRAAARDYGVAGRSRMTKQELIDALEPLVSSSSSSDEDDAG